MLRAFLAKLIQKGIKEQNEIFKEIIRLEVRTKLVKISTLTSNLVMIPTKSTNME